jgi:hypothetical protein
VFQQVQQILSNRRLAGDRSWRRLQHLKGSAYCARCGERLGYGHSVGRGGEYPYFFCLGRHRQRTQCDLPYLGAEKVEAAFEDLWDGVTFNEEFVAVVREAVDKTIDEMQDRQDKQLRTQKGRLVALERQKQKLIDAYLADALPMEDLQPRQAAVQHEIIEARGLIKQASSKSAVLRRHLHTSLDLLQAAGDLYRQSADEQQQSLNQVFFDQAYVDVNENGRVTVVSVALKPEFEALIELAGIVVKTTEPGRLPASTVNAWSDGWLRALPRRVVCARARMRRSGLRPVASPSRIQENPGQLFADRGSNLSYLAEREGFEPSVQLPAHLFSRQANSTTLAPLRD